MTVSAVDARSRSAGDQVGARQGRPAAPPRSGGRLLGVRAGQIVAVQVALALLLAGAGHGSLVFAAAALAAAAVVLLAWIRLRRRWLFEWCGIGLRYLSRRRTLGPAAEPAALLGLVSPTARLLPTDLAGDAAAVVSDAYGLTAVLELGDPAGLVADTAQSLPSPASLLPAAGPDTPPMRVQLLLTGGPAPVPHAGAGTPATSYRQLTDGRLAGHERALLAVRVLRADGWSDDDLRRALSSAVRRARRRLAPVPARALGADAVLRVLGETAHHDAQPANEEWRVVRLGGLLQTTFRPRRWPDPRSETGRRLVPRLLALPATAITVSISAGPRSAAGTEAVPADLTVRLAAGDPNGLSSATQALRRLLAAEGVGARRLDGEHLDGLAATLPLGVTDVPGPQPVLLTTAAVAPATLDALELPIGIAGLMLGTNRHGAPVTARLFRAEPTRVALIGGVRAAQLVALRAMALGARIVVQTARPQVWEPFVRGVSAPGETIALIPPGRPISGPSGTPLQPLLVIVDVGPVGADPRPGPGWQASLVVRDDMTTADVDLVARADLVILQPLRPDESAVAGSALGLGGSAEWLTRIRPDMVGVVNRRALRWAMLSVTPIESQLVGPPARQ